MYVAMLRGINVSGHKPVRMEALRACFIGLGFGKVATYVQSGNVVFEAAIAGAAGLTGKIEAAIVREFGFTVPVLVKSAKELSDVIARNPLTSLPGVAVDKLHVTFLSGPAPKGALEQLLPLAAGPERVEIVGREVYLYCPNGYGRTKLSNTTIEKKLGLPATTRNWKTVNTLLAMAG
jgi:uncharacterized protein (DUF1697 family)